MPDPSEWTEWQHSRLLTLWQEGLSSRLIGEQIGKSKNSVVSKVHRLGLAGRPSPILRGVERKKRQYVKRAPRIKLPDLSEVKPLPVEIVQAVVVKPAPIPVRPIWIGPIRECCWPLGDPRTKDFRFCEAATRPGKHYCATHWRVAYQPVSEFA